MNHKRVTIYDIKYDLQNHDSNDHYFDRKTMKFFNQTLKDFSVKKMRDNLYYISAAMKDWNGKTMGISSRFYSFTTHRMYSDEIEAEAEQLLAEGDGEGMANATLQAPTLGKGKEGTK